MLIYCICTQYLAGAPFALITASIRRCMEVISLWHCWGGFFDSPGFLSVTVAFSSSAFFGLLFLIFLLTIPYRFSMGFRSDPKSLKGEQLLDIENPITYVQRQLQIWKQETEGNQEGDPLMATLFRNAVMQSLKMHTQLW